MTTPPLEIPILTELNQKISAVVAELAEQEGTEPQVLLTELLVAGLENRTGKKSIGNIEQELLNIAPRRVPEQLSVVLDVVFRGLTEHLVSRLPQEQQQRMGLLFDSMLPCCIEYLDKEMFILSQLFAHWNAFDGVDLVLLPLQDLAKDAEKGGNFLHPSEGGVSGELSGSTVCAIPQRDTRFCAYGSELEGRNKTP